MNKKQILENWKKEKEKQAKIEEEKLEEEKLENDFLQDKFNKKYLPIIFIILVPIYLLYALWTIFGTTFDEGMIRFSLGGIFLLFIQILIKHILINKIKKDERLK